MKLITTLSVLFFLITSCSNKTIFDQQVGSLHLSIDNAGRVISLKDISSHTDYIAKEASALLECRKYDTDTAMVKPLSAKMVENGTIELSYPNGVTIKVAIATKDGYFKMEIIEAEPLSEISRISWGPYNTNARGYIAQTLGLVRSDDFTIGMMGLEPNTDCLGFVLGNTALYTDEGASLMLTSFDHTRGRFVENIENQNNDLRRSEPIPVTVLGSSIALFGTKADKDSELDIIEKIELAEGLPHPMVNGEWNKRSIEGQKFCVWANYNEKSFEEHLELAKEMGARILCKPSLFIGGFLSNWGHFEIDEKLYPGGIKSLLKNSQKANEYGIGTTLYTLTTFMKPLSKREPYIAPIPDNRIQTWRYSAKVGKDIKKDDSVIVLKYDKNVKAILDIAPHKVVCIDNEMIAFGSFEVDGDHIIAKECDRGAFMSDKAEHSEQSEAKLMYVAGYRNLYPGTIDMSNEFSDRLYDVLYNSGQQNFIVDGFESCHETGYGNYTGNLFVKNFYDRCVADNKETLVTGSGFSQYSWHFMSHESWGEYDKHRGVRGTMMDYRLKNQMYLGSNHMPKKLGQYYPDEATVEDIEWLMGIATGWDSGVDFDIDIDVFKKNPNYTAIVEKLHLWTQARSEKAFTQEQKMNLKQTDRQYKLTKNSDGAWNLQFNTYWQNDKMKILPSSAMQAKVLSGENGEVRPCSIDWSWTHNPAPYDEIGLSDDMVHTSAEQPSKWSIKIPDYPDADSWLLSNDRRFLFVVRLSENAPCAVSDIKVTIDGKKVEIPVTLNPGEYLSIPHMIPWVCIYDSKHNLISDMNIRGYIPLVQRGATGTVTMSCKPEKKGEKPELILNARCQNGYFFQSSDPE